MILLLQNYDFDTYLIGHDIPQSKKEALEYLHEELANFK